MEKCLLYREENADFKSGLGGLDIGELAKHQKTVYSKAVYALSFFVLKLFLCFFCVGCLALVIL